MDNLIRDLNEDLYYDHEEFKNNAMYHQGLDEGKKEQQIEIAKKMILDGLENKDIAKYTELSIEEIDELRNNK